MRARNKSKPEGRQSQPVIIWSVEKEAGIHVGLKRKAYYNAEIYGQE